MNGPTPIRGQQQPDEEDGVKWLALLIRQGLLLIVAGIERRYALSDSKARSAVVK